MADTVRYVRDPPRAAELVIIGGGIVGTATAFHASRAGLRPVLLERRAALCTLTTPASTGAFRLQFDNREELRLARAGSGISYENNTRGARATSSTWTETRCGAASLTCRRPYWRHATGQVTDSWIPRR